MLKQLCLIPLCLGFVLTGLRAEILEQILVKVNGEIFTKTDLEQRSTKCSSSSAARSSATS